MQRYSKSQQQTLTYVSIDKKNRLLQQKFMQWTIIDSFLLVLCVQERNLSAIVTRAHREVNPVATVPVLFDKELVKILLALFRICF